MHTFATFRSLCILLCILGAFLAILIWSEGAFGQVLELGRVPRSPIARWTIDFQVAHALYSFFLACALGANFLGSRTLPLGGFLGLPMTSQDLLGLPRKTLEAFRILIES